MSREVDGVYSVYSETRPKARKVHKCDACHESIQPGHFYMRVVAIFDGEAETIKRCMRCQTIHKHLRKLGDCDMWPDERLNCGEEYKQHWGTDPPPEIAALAFALPGEVDDQRRTEAKPR
jgi:hypothetical protein